MFSATGQREMKKGRFVALLRTEFKRSRDLAIGTSTMERTANVSTVQIISRDHLFFQLSKIRNSKF